MKCPGVLAACLLFRKAVIHSGCYTVGELRELMEYLARLLRVPLDAKHMAVYSRDVCIGCGGLRHLFHLPVPVWHVGR